MPQRTTKRIASILEELSELEANQHGLYYKHEQKGREHMAFLLLELKAIEKKEN